MPNESELFDPEIPNERKHGLGLTEEYYESPWKRPIEVDRTLLLPKATSKRVSVTIPTYEETELAIAVLDKDGMPTIVDEKPLYKMRKAKVFSGYKTVQINLPGEQIYNVDLTSSYLSEFDVPALRGLISLYADLQIQTLKGKDRLDDMYYVYNKIMGIVNTAKSREGKTARLAKTTISEGTSKQQIIDEFKREQDKHRWMPGNY